MLYSDELMRFTSAYMAEGERTVETLGKALASFHVANGCVGGDADAIWQNLGPAAQQWQLVDTAARAKRRWAHCAFLRHFQQLGASHSKGHMTSVSPFAQLAAAQQLILVEPQTLKVVYLPQSNRRQ